MKRLSLTNLPPASTGQDTRWRWVVDQFNRIAQASRRDDDFNSLATRMGTLQASATYDPPNLGAGAVGVIQTIAVTGAALGMTVDASFDKDMQGMRLLAWISAADTVSYQFQNPTAGALNLASGTVRVRAWSYTP